MTVRPLRVFAGAGEASGDAILAALLRGLRAGIPEDRTLDVTGFGGPLAESQGLRAILSVRDLAVNGILDVLRRAVFLARAYARLRRALKTFQPAFQPDLILLVDYPGMNVGLARLARRRGIPVHYVAPPQLWAYRDPARRLGRLRAALESPPGRAASLQFLFPFEAGSYAPWNGPVCQGHFFPEPAFEPARGTRLLLCPGSRPSVLARNLPLWLDRVRAFFGTLEGVDVLVPESLRDEAQRLAPGLEILSDKEQAFARAGAAIAFPGTITLELFLRRIPVRAWAVVDPLTLWMGRRRLRGPWLSLPNVLVNVREAGQGAMERGPVAMEWFGTVTDFKLNPPTLPDSIREWTAPGTEDALPGVWEAMGSEDGVQAGVRACLSLLGLPDAPGVSAR